MSAGPQPAHTQSLSCRKGPISVARVVLTLGPPPCGDDGLQGQDGEGSEGQET